MIYYAILPIEKINLPDWSQLYQDRDTARRNIEGTHVVISFLKAYKEEFESITEIEALDTFQIESLINSPEWIIEDDLE